MQESSLPTWLSVAGLPPKVHRPRQVQNEAAPERGSSTPFRDIKVETLPAATVGSRAIATRLPRSYRHLKPAQHVSGRFRDDNREPHFSPSKNLIKTMKTFEPAIRNLFRWRRSYLPLFG